jgi:hypothetical protein
MSRAAAVILVALLVTGAWFADRWLWRRRSRDKLVAMSASWRLYKPVGDKR